MFLPDSLPKLDWETYDSFDTTKQWEAFAIFLERRGVFLFGTDAYRNAPLAPFNPPASPFSATRDEDFIYRGSPSQGRRKSYWHAHPFCRYAVDDLGRDLYVKAVPKASDEWRILEFLTSPELRDPANHTIPIVSVLHHPDGETVFLIQAKWGSEWLWPDLESMNERYMVAHQLLEGLAFMHRNGIGHGVRLHFLHRLIFTLRTWSGITTTCETIQQPPTIESLNAILIFALLSSTLRRLSVQFPIDSSNHDIPSCRCVRPPLPFRSPEQDREGETFSLFAADVYGLGQILIYEASHAKAILPPEYNELLSRMIALEPRSRPSAEEALKCLQALMDVWQTEASKAMIE
ncbi:hypothetical protein BDZ97DRAFT_1758087 [Flammula alnicola]|nr:hypothetical protein BDZ97DRAFT_1758087 [Flammula alnicola]